MNPGTRGLLLAGLALVVIAGAAGAIFRSWYDQQPPPPESGAVRLASSASPSLPPIEQAVHGPDGSMVILSIAGLDRQGGRLVGHVAVREGFQRTVLDLGQGESGNAYGVEVHAVHLWSMPNPRHDAIDVTIG